MATKPEKEIYDFLVTLYGDNEGVICAPTKGAAAKSFIPYFFNWPEQKNDIVQHMLQANAENKDAWITPALLKSNKSRKAENWLGTQFLFADFDDGVPTKMPTGVPEPTFKIQSSTEGREHWYWKLNKFETDRKVIAQLNKALVYALSADKGVHDPVRVLRAPGTKHRKTGRLTTLLKHESSRVYSLTDFKIAISAVPSEKVRLKQELKDIEPALKVLTSGRIKKIPYDVHEILNRTKEEWQALGDRDRSGALWKFCMDLLEANPKIFKADLLSLAWEVEKNLGKFADRSSSVEEQFFKMKTVTVQEAYNNFNPQQADDVEREEEAFLTIAELAEYISANPPRWLIKGMLPEQQTMQIVGPPNIGKSSLAVRLCADIICGNDFLMWQAGDTEKQHSVAYCGLDMDQADAHDMVTELLKTLSPDEIKKFQSHFKISTPDYGIDLWHKDVQAQYEQLIAETRASIVVFDSLKDTGALDGDDKRKAIYKWFKRTLRRKMGLTVIVLHHTRKSDKDSKIHKTQDDVYGSGMQNADIKASLMLYQKNQSDKVIHVNQTKVRRAKKIPVFTIQRSDSGLLYEVVEEEVDTTEPTPGNGSNGVFQGYAQNLIDEAKQNGPGLFHD